MKKDIKIPIVKDVYVAIVQEYNDIYKTKDWNAYIINSKVVALETVLIVSKGYSQEKATTTMRHKLDKLPAKSYAKIELVHEDVFMLNNEFRVTFFENNQLLDKTYLFEQNSINTGALQPIPLMNKEGVLAK